VRESVSAGADIAKVSRKRSLQVVDATGAGHAFHAGYLAGSLRGGQSLPDRLRFASVLASEKCEIGGPD